MAGEGRGNALYPSVEFPKAQESAFTKKRGSAGIESQCLFPSITGLLFHEFST